MTKECTHCGQCCKNIPCGMGFAFLGDHRPCYALEEQENGTFLCGLVLHAGKYMELGENEKMKEEFIALCVRNYNAMGKGCDTVEDYTSAMHRRMSHMFKLKFNKKIFESEDF